jgi:hypothetical protein
VEAKPGDLVFFRWWSSYKAPSEAIDEDGSQIWCELFDGDRGVVIRIDDDGHPVCLFNRYGTLITVYPDMVEVIP